MWFWFAAALLTVSSGVATFNFVNDETNEWIARALLTGSGSLLGLLLAVVLCFVFLLIITPYTQRNEAREGWIQACKLLEQSERQRRPRPLLPYFKFAPLVHNEIATGRALLARWPEDPDAEEFYDELYLSVDHWQRDVEELLTQTHINWSARARGGPSLWDVPPNPEAVKSWMQERIRRLEELVATEED
jgi:hypothetical protein